MNKQETLNNIDKIFTTTDEMLMAWTEEGKLPVPTLVGRVSVKLGWNDKQYKENDPIVRYYLRRHDNYKVALGAYGGIERLEDFEKRTSSKKEIKLETIVEGDSK